MLIILDSSFLKICIFVLWKITKQIRTFLILVCLGLYIDVLSVSVRFNIIFCIYEHIQNYFLRNFQILDFSKYRKHVVCYFRSKNCPKWSLTPSPPLASAKVSCQGAKQLMKKQYVRFILWFL